MTARFHDLDVFVSRIFKHLKIEPTYEQRDTVEKILINLEAEVVAKFYKELSKGERRRVN